MKLKNKIILTIFIIFNILLNSSCLAISTEEINISAPYAILVDTNSGTIIYEKNAYEKTAIASTTKIMTAILVLENCNLEDIATASFDALISVPYDYTNAAIQVDEQLSINDLLHVLLIYSANDAANVLAEHVGGSISSFASMMNTKATELGCTSTHFTNPSGMDDENHYSCAYDLYLIAKYAMQNETFKNIVCKTSCSLPSTEKYEKTDRIFNTTNYLLRPNQTYFYEYANGLKTGYTNDAKDCLVASAKKDNLELISIALGVNTEGVTTHEKFNDCKTLFEFGFANYTSKEIILQDSICKQVKIPNGTKDTRNLDLLYQNSVFAFCETNKTVSVDDFKIVLKENLTAPISKGEILGTATYTANGINYSTNLIAANDVEESKELNLFFKILLIIFVLFIVYTILKPKKKKKNRRK